MCKSGSFRTIVHLDTFHFFLDYVLLIFNNAVLSFGMFRDTYWLKMKAIVFFDGALKLFGQHFLLMNDASHIIIMCCCNSDFNQKNMPCCVYFHVLNLISSREMLSSHRAHISIIAWDLSFWGFWDLLGFSMLSAKYSKENFGHGRKHSCRRWEFQLVNVSKTHQDLLWILAPVALVIAGCLRLEHYHYRHCLS